ncbi:MAG: ATP-binding protein [Candidatus Latescibacterota bacterium]
MIPANHGAAVATASRAAAAVAREAGLAEAEAAQVSLAAGELAANLVRHAGGGQVRLAVVAGEGRRGVRVIAADRGPGIADVHRAMRDGYSSAGGLGYGLGAVNRLMDELEVSTRPGEGTTVVCTKWVASSPAGGTPCPLDFGAAVRPHPGAVGSGDAWLCEVGADSALVGLIDGLGHGPYAARAALAARQFVVSHREQPLDYLFQGVGHACRATRGVVMALARIEWAAGRLSFAGIGNVAARVLEGPTPASLVTRRGVVGGRAPLAAVQQAAWDAGCLLVMHTDGVSARWQRSDLAGLAREPAQGVARALLQAWAGGLDDAAVLVVRGSRP